MSNITIAGNTYSDVPKIMVPKVGGGFAEYSEGGSLKHIVLRPDATLEKTYSYDKKIHADENVTIPSYTTNSTTLKASETLSPTYSMDFLNYNYYVAIRMLTVPAYTVATKGKGRVEYSFASALYEVAEWPAYTFLALSDRNVKLTSRSVSIYAAGNACRIIYWSGTSAITAYASAAYGTAQTVTAPAVSSSTLTLKSPALIIRGHTTYFTSTYFNALSDIRYQWKIEVYRAPKSNLAFNGWGLYDQSDRIIYDAQTAEHTLT